MLIDKTYHHPINPVDCYNGLNNLKKAGVRVSLTPEQAGEIYKCKNSFEYFLENYVEILSLDKGQVPFKPYEYQRRAMKKIVDNRFSILRWPRQMGKCFSVNTYVKIRNKTTGLIEEITIGELYEKQKSKIRMHELQKSDQDQV